MTTPMSTPPIETTGRYLVLLPTTDISSGIQALADTTGINAVARASDFPGHTFLPEQLENSDIAVFDTIGVAVVSLDPDQVQSVQTAISTNRPLRVIEPERIVYAIGDGPTSLSADYLQGYRDAVNHLVDQAVAPSASAIDVPNYVDGAATWGLQATGVVNSAYSGLGVKVAVLDTGLDLTHPDFAGRSISSQSFIQGESVQDANGHGTHCIGTACGPRVPPNPPRYGIAYNSEIFAGKVLSNRGSGSDGGILAGIEWAISNGCHIISMSLGAPTRPGDSFSRIYEAVAQRSLARGTLIIAAAGNESDRRNGQINPVGYPANCPSIMAVAAVDSKLQVAFFSTSSINFDGGQIDIAGPGVNILSTWPMPTRYRSISGTSMATPHVAGIAALYAGATGLKGMDLWGLLMRDARRLPISSLDIGAGLVQVPK